MVQAKTQLFGKELTHSARLFRALSHPARLRILKFLAETNTCITGDISDDLPLGRTTVNQHLAELKDAELITGHIEGVKTRYCLNTEKIVELRNVLGEFLSSLDLNKYHCK
ncbi:MAG: metalloregulator ArsR/SmtB family transcription factor [Bacteroidales bacterium]|nr:metalloregulator ArsR/SmtB family transcription factor [Bacteroidales bacterium]